MGTRDQAGIFSHSRNADGDTTYTTWQLPADSGLGSDLDQPITPSVNQKTEDHSSRPPSSGRSPRRKVLSTVGSPCLWHPRKAGPSWPLSCKYFAPGLMDPEAALYFITNDSKYTDPLWKAIHPVLCIDLGGPESVSVRTLASDTPGPEASEILALSSLSEHSTRIWFLPVSREFISLSSTRCRFSLSQTLWSQTLEYSMIPPTALELLHNKDGGHCSFVSYCMDNQSDSEIRSEDDKPCAYHVCLKLCCWLGEEHFLYARHDFHTGKNFLLVTGLNGEQVTRKMKAQFGGRPQPHILLTILAITTTWLQHIRSVGWNLDCATQRLESETGYANLNFQAIRPLPPDKLSLRRELAAVRASLHAAARASRQLGERLNFLSSQVSAYHDAQNQASAMAVASPLTRLDCQLIQTCEHQKAEQTAQHEQLMGLIRRLDVQWDVVTALRADHNSRLTMEMARDSRNDSILMRRIAFVTIIFLPATFMATFFSMSFFRVSNGQLTVSSWIWLYAVCTIPLTLVLGIGYSDIPERWRRLRGSLANLNRKEE